MKKPPTAREPSARLTQKVTVKNVVPSTDAMLLIAYQLQVSSARSDAVTPTIIDLEVFSMIDLVEARDKRLVDSGGRWFGNYETPCVLSKIGQEKLKKGIAVDTSIYGRKESEKRDFNEDTNFGKLKRIPHPALQAFLGKHSAQRTITFQESRISLTIFREYNSLRRPGFAHQSSTDRSLQPTGNCRLFRCEYACFASVLRRRELTLGGGVGR